MATRLNTYPSPAAQQPALLEVAAVRSGGGELEGVVAVRHLVPHGAHPRAQRAPHLGRRPQEGQGERRIRQGLQGGNSAEYSVAYGLPKEVTFP